MKPIDDIIQYNKYYLTKCEFVKKNFPDVKVSKYYNNGYSIFNINKFQSFKYNSLYPPIIEFSSPTINSQFTNVEFVVKYGALYVTTYSYLEFTYDNKDEQITIYCCPRQNKIASTIREFRKNEKPIDKIVFCPYVSKFSKNNFKKDLLEETQSQIFSFIRKYSTYALDTTNLDNTSKKLLTFM